MAIGSLASWLGLQRQKPAQSGDYDSLPKVPADSSNVKQIAFSPDDHTVYVEFLSGSVYAYIGVSDDVWWKIVKSPSVGVAVYDFLRGADGRRNLKAADLDHRYPTKKIR